MSPRNKNTEQDEVAFNENSTQPVVTTQLGVLALSQEEIENAQGFHVVNAGRYAVEIKKAIARYSKKGGPMIELSLRPVIDDDPLAGTFRCYINLPIKGMPPERTEMCNVEVKRFVNSIGTSIEEFITTINPIFASLVAIDQSAPLSDLIGGIGYVLITLDSESSYVDEQTGQVKISSEQNRVAKWITSDEFGA